MRVGRIELSGATPDGPRRRATTLAPQRPALTDGERTVCQTARVAASHETDVLLGIIERLTGEKIEPADAPEPDPFADFDRYGYPSEP